MITSTKIDNIQKRIKLAIAQIAREENVSIEFGTCRYTANQYRSTMTVNTLDKKTTVVVNANTSLCKLLGFTQNVIGMEFNHSKVGKCVITDIKPRSPKFPIIGKSSNGKSYKFTVEQTKRLLGGDNLINRSANLDKLVG